MNLSAPRMLTINGGSSSIKFAPFEADGSLRRILEGAMMRIGLPETTLQVKGDDQTDNFSRLVTTPDQTVAVGVLIEWIEDRIGRDALAAVGHRVVHGGPKYSKSRRVTADVLEELHRLTPLDPEHLPAEILLIEAFEPRFPDLPQVACFDAAFHHDPPRVARLLSIPRRYEAHSVRAAEAVALFCYQVKKWIGAFAATLRGLDTLGFAGGIGANAPTVRSRVREGLGFLQIELDDKCNAGNESVISSETSRIAVRVIHTDEEWMIASAACRVLGLTIEKEHHHAKKQDEDDG